MKIGTAHPPESSVILHNLRLSSKVAGHPSQSPCLSKVGRPPKFLSPSSSLRLCATSPTATGYHLVPPSSDSPASTSLLDFSLQLSITRTLTQRRRNSDVTVSLSSLAGDQVSSNLYCLLLDFSSYLELHCQFQFIYRITLLVSVYVNFILPCICISVYISRF